jgi:hypothetical protein
MDTELQKKIEEKSAKLALSDKLVRQEKKIMFCAIYLMFYKGKPKTFVRDMGISKIIFDTWYSVHKLQAEEMLSAYKDGVKKDIMEELGMTEGDAPIPTADSIKSKILTKLYDSVQTESDPAKLAAALKVLAKYDKEEKETKQEKKRNIYDDLKNL